MFYGSFVSGEYKIPGKTLTRCKHIQVVYFLENLLKLPVLALELLIQYSYSFEKIQE